MKHEEIIFDRLPYEEVPKEYKKLVGDELLDYISTDYHYTKRSAFYREMLEDHIYTLIYNSYTEEYKVEIEGRY